MKKRSLTKGTSWAKSHISFVWLQCPRILGLDVIFPPHDLRTCRDSQQKVPPLVE